jgi:hypothetical protein
MRPKTETRVGKELFNGDREEFVVGRSLNPNGKVQSGLMGDPETFFQSLATHLQIVIDIR